jgi:hypothetical protein
MARPINWNMIWSVITRAIGPVSVVKDADELAALWTEYVGPRSSGMGRRSTDAAGEEEWVIEAASPVLPTRLGNSLSLDGVGSSSRG